MKCETVMMSDFYSKKKITNENSSDSLKLAIASGLVEKSECKGEYIRSESDRDFICYNADDLNEAVNSIFGKKIT